MPIENLHLRWGRKVHSLHYRGGTFYHKRGSDAWLADIQQAPSIGLFPVNPKQSAGWSLRTLT